VLQRKANGQFGCKTMNPCYICDINNITLFTLFQTRELTVGSLHVNK